MSDIGEKRVSAVTSLKEIVVFLAAVAFTNGISTLLIKADSKTIRVFSEITASEYICFALLITGLIRFFHGNSRLLDENYLSANSRGGLKSDVRNNILWFDFLVVLFIAIMFAAMSFFVGDFTDFCAIYVFIIVVDVIWLFCTDNQKLREIVDVVDGRLSFQITGLSWLYNNVVHLLMIALFVGVYYSLTAIYNHEHIRELASVIKSMNFEQDRFLFWGIITLLISNSICDFVFNWNLYFPYVNQMKRSPSKPIKPGKHWGEDCEDFFGRSIHAVSYKWADRNRRGAKIPH